MRPDRRSPNPKRRPSKRHEPSDHPSTWLGRSHHRRDRTHPVASAASLTGGAGMAALILFMLALLGWLPTAGGGVEKSEGQPERERRRDQLELIAPKCSHHVSASVAPHVEGEYRLHGLHRSRCLERAPAVDRDDWRRRLLAARPRHDHRERPNGSKAARACRSAGSATMRSTSAV